MLINILKLNEFIILMIHIFEFDYRLLFIFIGLIRKFKLLLKIYNLFLFLYAIDKAKQF